MHHAVPRVAGVVDDDVDLAAAKGRGLLDKPLEVFVVEHVAHDGQGAAAVGLDGGDCLLGLFAVNVGHDDLCGSSQLWVGKAGKWTAGAGVPLRLHWQRGARTLRQCPARSR